jgi:hypothetical protein
MCPGRECVLVYGWVRQLDTSPSTRRWTVEVYVPQVPHQVTVVVFGSLSIHTCHPNTIHLIYIGPYTYQYIGHETVNWLGCGGC